jgi:hypothetical protein
MFAGASSVLPAKADDNLPRIALQLTPAAVAFVQNGTPGLVQSLVPTAMPGRSADLRVVSSFRPRGWSVIAEGTSLVNVKGDRIGADRVFIGSPATRAYPAGGGGAGYRPLDMTVVVASGGLGDYTFPLGFRLLTTWNDPPGSYAGVVRFTAIINP